MGIGAGEGSVTYHRILSYVGAALWAITPEKMNEILAVLAFRASGQAWTPEEIEARVGSRAAGVGGGGAVGVLPVRGTIAHRMGGMDESSGGISAERLSAMLAQMVADPSVGTILLDVDSPGGTVTGVPELAAQIYDARKTKKVVALVNGMAGSAGYWLASQAEEVISIPSGMAGSIGVFTVHSDLSAALEKEGVKNTIISAGKHKVEGNPFEPLSDDAKAVIQSRVDDMYATFVKDVARGRGVTPAEVRGGFGEGRALPAKEAKAAGLIDRIATVEDTLSRVMGRSMSTGGARADAELPALALDETPASVDLDADRARRLRLL